ncbi:hypothetical protein X948_4245 [Burkholderia pseudomallei MSHR5608]|nr:hypothetical protein X948_4245 [Burkholderia pseudomallei MSHR5608]
MCSTAWTNTSSALQRTGSWDAKGPRPPAQQLASQRLISEAGALRLARDTLVVSASNCACKDGRHLSGPQLRLRHCGAYPRRRRGC